MYDINTVQKLTQNNNRKKSTNQHCQDINDIDVLPNIFRIYIAKNMNV